MAVVATVPRIQMNAIFKNMALTLQQQHHAHTPAPTPSEFSKESFSYSAPMCSLVERYVTMRSSLLHATSRLCSKTVCFLGAESAGSSFCSNSSMNTCESCESLRGTPSLGRGRRNEK